MLTSLSHERHVRSHARRSHAELAVVHSTRETPHGESGQTDCVRPPRDSKAPPTKETGGCKSLYISAPTITHTITASDVTKVRDAPEHLHSGMVRRCVQLPLAARNSHADFLARAARSLVRKKALHQPRARSGRTAHAAAMATAVRGDGPPKGAASGRQRRV